MILYKNRIPPLEFVLWALIFFVTLATYLPVILGDYLYHDDYYLLAVGGRSCRNHPQYIGYLTEYGRPLGIYIKCIYSTFIDIPFNANIPRGITLVAIAFLGLLLFLVIKREVRSLSIGLLVAAIAITFPPFQTSAAMIANSTHIYAAIFGLLAGAQSLKINLSAELIKNIFHATISTALFIIALLIYQPGAFLYATPIALAILCRPSISNKHVINQVFTALIPMLIAMLFYLTWFFSLGSKRGGVETNPATKLNWFLNDVLPNVFSFGSLTPVSSGTLVSVLLLLLLGGITLWHLRRRNNFFEDSPTLFSVFILKIISVFFLALIAYLPNLAASESDFVFRSLIAFQPTVFIILVCSIYKFLLLNSFSINFKFNKQINLIFLFKLTLAITLIAGIISAHKNVAWLYVVPQTIELNYVKETLRTATNMKLIFESKCTSCNLDTLATDTIPNIHVVRPKDESLLTGFAIKDEFGAMSSQFFQDTPFLVLGALRGLGFIGHHVKVTTGTDSATYDFPNLDLPPSRKLPVPEGSIVIDMNKIGIKFIKK